MRKIQIVIISLVAVLVLGCAVFATLYFATDVFKSDKELFYKYVSQMDLKEIAESNEFNNYQERLKNEKYKNEGVVSIGLNIGEEINVDETFNYISKVDLANKLAQSNATINKEGKDLLSVNYLRNEDIYGVKLEQIVNQYIAFENGNLKEFAKKFGIEDVTQIPDKIEVAQYNYDNIISKEELEQIYNKYINIIIEQIPKESYSKVEKTKIALGETTIEADGYELKIDVKTLQKILKSVLNSLKDDEQIFNLINSAISVVDSSQELNFKEYKETLEDAIEEISEEPEENFNIANIIVYKNGKDTVKIYAKAGMDVDNSKSYLEASLSKNEEKILIDLNIVAEENNINANIIKNIKTANNDECQIEITISEDEEEVANISIETIRNGNLSSDTIENSMMLSAVLPQNNIELSLELDNNKTFDPSIEIEEFTQSDHAVINEFDYTQINNLMTNLNNIISEKTGLNAVEIIGTATVGILSTALDGMGNTALIGGGLIGATVGVTMTGANNLFEQAQEAKTDSIEAYEQEQELISQRIEVDGIWYDSTEDYINGVPSTQQNEIEQDDAFSNSYTPEDVRVNIDTNYIVN